MDILFIVLSFTFLLLGLVGSVLPIPGPPLSFVGLLFLHFSNYASFSEDVLFAFGGVTVLVTALDYYVPIWGTKKFGGTKAGVRGSIAGLIIGLFFGPFGMFIGAFLGALLGELFLGDKQHALKAAIGSFVGFAVGMIAKLTLCGFMLFYAIRAIWQ